MRKEWYLLTLLGIPLWFASQLVTHASHMPSVHYVTIDPSQDKDELRRLSWRMSVPYAEQRQRWYIIGPERREEIRKHMREIIERAPDGALNDKTFHAYVLTYGEQPLHTEN
jgi:hypothetical protein